MPDKPEVIQINYNAPRGQVGVKPRKVRLKEAFEVKCDLKGELSIEFTGKSPLKGGQKKVVAGEGKSFVVEEPGRYAFRCLLKDETGHTLELGNPADPATGVGGELEVHC